jgi:hypothetical protein
VLNWFRRRTNRIPDGPTHEFYAAGIMIRSDLVRLESGETVTLPPGMPTPGVDTAVTLRGTRQGGRTIALEVRQRASPNPVKLFLRPMLEVSSWAIAARLAQTNGDASESAEALQAAEVARERGIDPVDFEEMKSAALWALAILNPPGQTIHQVVADRDDVELAVDLAVQTMEDENLKKTRALLDRIK